MNNNLYWNVYKSLERELLALADITIYTLARKGLIPAYKRGKKLYFYEDELLQWIESGRKPLQALNFQEQAAEIVLGVKRKPKGGFNL